MSFPISEPPARSYYSVKVVKEQTRTDFEDGTVQTAPKYTRGRKKWTIGWKSLPDSDYNSLINFFENNVGKTFSWSDHKGDDFIVRFSKGELPRGKIVGFKDGEDLWDTGEIQIEEK